MMLEARPVRQTSGTEHRTMSPTTEFETRGAAEISQPVGVETRLASEVKQLLADGRQAEAAERFNAIVELQQRRAARIAYHYLRDPGEVDDAVQDACLKAFVHLPSFREGLFFELWFTRILVNSCLDRIKARNRRTRWQIPTGNREGLASAGPPSHEPSPEASLLAKERRTQLEAAIDRLPTRQRTAVILVYLEGQPTREVAAVMGLNESTVRVHLFRAVRKLRSFLSQTGSKALFEPLAHTAGQGI